MFDLSARRSWHNHRKHERVDQQQEQGRLKLEVASLKTPARIEAIAKGTLGMSLPTEQQVVVVK